MFHSNLFPELNSGAVVQTGALAPPASNPPQDAVLIYDRDQHVRAAIPAPVVRDVVRELVPVVRDLAPAAVVIGGVAVCWAVWLAHQRVLPQPERDFSRT